MKDEMSPADDDQSANADIWAEEIANAQRERTVAIRGRIYKRVPFGRDIFGQASPRQRCRDCGAARGEFHVPACCWEECPRCGGQAVSCDCSDAY